MNLTGYYIFTYLSNKCVKQLGLLHVYKTFHLTEREVTRLMTNLLSSMVGLQQEIFDCQVLRSKHRHTNWYYYHMPCFAQARQDEQSKGALVCDLLLTMWSMGLFLASVCMPSQRPRFFSMDLSEKLLLDLSDWRITWSKERRLTGAKTVRRFRIPSTTVIGNSWLMGEFHNV